MIVEQYAGYFALTAVTARFIQHIHYHHWQPAREIKRLLANTNPENREKYRIFQQIFSPIKGKKISRLAQKQLNIRDNIPYVYGEIQYLSFVKLLDICQLGYHERFMDFGSGTGKSVFAASFYYPFDSCQGVEFLAPLHAQSEALRIKILENPELSQKSNTSPENIGFLHADFLTVDISHITVLFINATAFMGPLWQQIETKLKTLPTQAKIILTSRTLPETDFTLIHHKSELMSWGMVPSRIYCRK